MTQILAGCAQRQERDRSGSLSAGVGGAWAQEFSDAIEDASSYEMDVLEDGTITAAELADAQARNSTCMQDSGFVLHTFEDGTSEVKMADGGDLPATETVNSAMQNCSRRFDRSITMLFNEIRRNPEKQDEATIAVGCLRAADLVGAGYTERKWRAENDSGRFTFDEYDAAAVQCRLDPLGLWREP